MDWLENIFVAWFEKYFPWFDRIGIFERMKRTFDQFMGKISENNNAMMEYAENFRNEIDKNYVSRSRIHN